MSCIKPFYPLLVVIREAMQNEIIWSKQLTFFWSFSLCKGTFTRSPSPHTSRRRSHYFTSEETGTQSRSLVVWLEEPGLNTSFLTPNASSSHFIILPVLKGRHCFFFFFKLAYNNSICIIGQVFLDGFSMNMACNPQNSPIGQSLLLSSLRRWGNWDREAQ